MTTIYVQERSSDWYMQDGEWYCSHPEAYIEKACCPGGEMNCGCMGADEVVCPAVDCTGIEDWQVDEIYDQLTND